LLVLLFALQNVMADNGSGDKELQKLLNKLEHAKSDTARVAILLQLYDSYGNSKQDSLAFESLSKAAYYAHRSGNLEYLAKVYHYFAMFYSNNDLKLAYLDSIYDIALKLDDKELEAKTLRDYADYYITYSKYNKVVEYLLNAEQVLQKIKDSLELAKVYNTLGVAYKKMLNYEYALKYYLKAMDILDKKGDTEGYVAMLNNIAFVHRLLKNDKIALDYFEKAIKAAEKIKDEKKRKRLIAKTSLSVAIMYNEMGDYEKAWEYISKKYFCTNRVQAFCYAFAIAFG